MAGGDGSTSPPPAADNDDNDKDGPIGGHERKIATRMQKEKEEEAEIIGHNFFSTPAPLHFSASTDLKLDKYTACIWYIIRMF